MKRVIGISLILLVAVACSAPKVQQTLTTPAIKTEVKAVAVISPTGEDKGGFADCVRDSLSSSSSNLEVMSEKEFRDALFPWYEPETHPRTWQELQDFVNRPVVQKRLQELGVRYVIEAGGETTSNFKDFWGPAMETAKELRGSIVQLDKKGAMLCGPFPACIGIMGWTRKSNVSVTLWDLEQGALVGNLGVEVTGKNVLPAFIFAFPFISPTETGACNEIGERLAEFFASGGVQGNQPSEPSNMNISDEK
jgi:hypothetical protein